jgi:hypothetical protein
MKYVCVTHVDSFTKIAGFRYPMKNGPSFPELKNLNLEWWDESNWPLTHPNDYPKFYGTCDDDSNFEVDGVLHVFADVDGGPTAKEQYDELQAQEIRARLPSVATPRQIRLALLELGMLELVSNFIAGLEEPMKSKVMIEWEYSLEINKNSPIIQALSEQMGLTQEDLDNIFIKAASVGMFDPNATSSSSESES